MPNLPFVPGADGPLIPPAFLEDDESEGSDWGWADWDAPDLWDYRDVLPY